MRKTIYLLLILLIQQLYSFAQASNSQNYVMTNTVKLPGITNESQVPGIPIATQGKSQTIAYFDGLGRPLQTVITQGGASQKDIIAGNEYDAYGREVKKYLPYADINNTATPGSYKSGWQTTQASFYNGQLQGVDIDASPYSQSVLEASPLNRVQAQGAPGTVWQPNLSNAYDASKKTIQQYYEINTAADNIHIFNIDASGNITTTANYADGLLSVSRSVDEHGGVTKQFTDKTGHMILKQVYIEAGDILQTYYIYDDLDLLRAVIQPEGVAAIPTTGSWTADATFKTNWVFQYTYDSRNRMITKTVPGAAAVYMIYDQWDRLVLTQDGNLRAATRWLFTKYDALNRPIVTGTITDNRSQATIQNAVTLLTARYETVSTGATEGYTLNATFPSSSSYTLTVYTTTHYDSYSNLPSWASGYGFVSENGVTNYNNNLQGQVVATQTRILNTSNFLRSVVYYDDKYRNIQSTADNAANGKDRMTSVLSWDGKPLQQYQSHTSNVYTTALVVKKAYSYDHADRVLTVTHKIGSGEEITLVANAYNELGQLLNKKIHQSSTFITPLQKLDYSYNIRGWLNGINQPYTNGTGYDETDLFNFKLNYNSVDLGGNNQQYNGNIAEQIWKGGYDEYLRGYKYGYDLANRLKTSDYGFKYLNSNNLMVWDFSMKYNENIPDLNQNGVVVKGYDHNGNIKNLYRYHGSWQLVDALGYSYKDGYGNNIGNQLGKIDESAYGSPVGFIDRNNGYWDYGYDANGNLTADYNKDITSITYNHLNLPTLVTFGGTKGTIAYDYDAAGNKLQKTVTEKTTTPNKITITKYAGAFVYTNSYLANASPIPTETLEFIGHDEGRIRPAKLDAAQPLTAANTKYIYDYFMKDHLGNTRMVLTTEQQTDVYAATEETANATKEDALFANLSSTRIAKPTTGAGFDTNGSNTQVSKLNGGAANTRVGPSIILKVEAGDIISISTKAWYTQSAQAVPNGLAPLKDQLLSLLTAGIVANNGTHGGAISTTDINNGGSSVLTDFLGGQPYNSSYPKAFLNWVIVDEEFKKVSSSFHMGAVQVSAINSTSENAKTLVGPAGMTVRRNGWLYVYLSNESNQDVYFDDLVINHKRGPVVEANNYYAFGLEIPGLGSKAIGFGNNPVNRKKYNGIEFDADLDLNVDEAFYRNLDPATGRWWQIDPKVDAGYENQSPYGSMYDDPVKISDPLGDEGNACCKEVWHEIKGALKETGKAWSEAGLQGVSWVNENINPINDAIELVTGKDYNLPGNPSVSRTDAALGIFLTIVGEKVFGNTAKTLFQSESKAVITATEKEAPKSMTSTWVESGQVSPDLVKRYEKLNKVDRPGQDMTKAGKDVVKDINTEVNGGNMKCVNCGTTAVPAKKSTRGVTPAPNEAHVDHVNRKRNGGSGTPINGDVLCERCNVKEKH